MKVGARGISGSPAAVAEQGQPLDGAGDRGCKQRPAQLLCVLSSEIVVGRNLKKTRVDERRRHRER